MRPAVLLAAIAPVALASPLSFFNFPRAQTAVQKVVASINNIESNIKTVNGSLNNFHKGDPLAVTEVLTIEQNTDNLGKAIQSATATAKSSPKFNPTDSGTIANAVINLEPQIFSLLANIEKKKPAFDSAILGVGSVSPQVEQSLKQQKGYSDAFGKALTAKLSTPYSQFGPVIQKQIDAKFDKAIALYATSGGVFAVPAEPSFAAFKAAVLKAVQEVKNGLIPTGI